jgi:sugar phosphate permease
MLPVVLTMISNWFPDAERGRANAIVIMFVPIAGIITARSRAGLSPFSTGAGCSSLKVCSRRCLVLWAYTVYDRPQEARWISEAEKNYLVETLAAEQKPLPEPKSKMPLWARCFPIKPCGSSSR